MKKTTLYLLDDQAEKLKEIAKRRGGKVAEWIRRGVDLIVEKEEKKNG